MDKEVRKWNVSENNHSFRYNRINFVIYILQLLLFTFELLFILSTRAVCLIHFRYSIILKLLIEDSDWLNLRFVLLDEESIYYSAYL